jgi:putative DNA primase/helicase
MSTPTPKIPTDFAKTAAEARERRKQLPGDDPRAAAIDAWDAQDEAESDGNDIQTCPVASASEDATEREPAEQDGESKERAKNPIVPEGVAAVPIDADEKMHNPRLFFERWFAGCKGTVQFVAIRPDGPVVGVLNLAAPYDWGAAVDWAHEQSATGANVYFCPITQQPGTTGRGSETTAFELPGVFADVDGLDGSNDFWASIEATGRVTAAAWSGAGLHVYGRFPEPLMVDPHRETLKDLVYSYGAAMNQAAHGDGRRRVDRFDLASLLRFPTTTNYPNAKKRKVGRDPEPTFIFSLTDETITHEQLASLIAADPRPTGGASTERENGAKPRASGDATEPGVLPAEWHEWLAADAILRARFERTRPGPKQTDTSASGFLLSLFNHLARKYRDRITDAEALAIGVAFYRRADEKPRLPAIRRTWNEAKTTKITEHDATDVGNARRYAKQHGHRVRYVYPWHRWLIYDGTRWADDTTGEIERLAKETAEMMLTKAYELPVDDPRRETRIKQALASKSRQKLAAMIELARPECAERPEAFDRDPFLFNCQNGTLDLRTGELRPHDPNDMLTKIAPVKYDPNAECPRWLAFLDRIFGNNARLIGYVQRALGAAMVGTMQEQCFHILHGSGANGKSTFLEAVRPVFGDYGMNAAPNTLLNQRNPAAIRSDLARLKDARFVTASETNKGGTLDEATIKALTGGDTITARRLYQGEEEFRSASHIFLSTNYKPRIKGTDHAIWRRVRPVPFTVTIPPDEQDLNLGAKLREELPGIFSWIVEGAIAVQEAGGKLEPVPEVVEAVEKYRREMDDVGRFLEDCTVKGTGGSVGAMPLHDAYAKWCAETGRKALALKPFRHALEERGQTSERRNGGQVWLDLGLAEEAVFKVPCGACGFLVELPAGKTVGVCSCSPDRRLRVIPLRLIPRDEAA